MVARTRRPRGCASFPGRWRLTGAARNSSARSAGAGWQAVDLPEAVRRELVDRYREHFRDETPVIEQGLFCAESRLVYLIVSDIPVLLVDDALPADAVGR